MPNTTDNSATIEIRADLDGNTPNWGDQNPAHYAIEIEVTLEQVREMAQGRIPSSVRSALNAIGNTAAHIDA